MSHGTPDHLVCFSEAERTLFRRTIHTNAQHSTAQHSEAGGLTGVRSRGVARSSGAIARLLEEGRVAVPVLHQCLGCGVTSVGESRGTYSLFPLARVCVGATRHSKQQSNNDKKYVDGISSVNICCSHCTGVGEGVQARWASTPRTQLVEMGCCQRMRQHLIRAQSWSTRGARRVHRATCHSKRIACVADRFRRALRYKLIRWR